MYYNKIINAYTYCQVFSKELDTISMIFRALNIKTKTNFTAYIHAIEAAKTTFKSIPNVKKESIEFQKICGSLRDLNKYYKYYDGVENFIETERMRLYIKNQTFDTEYINQITLITKYNNCLESFWYKLYDEYLPK